MLIRINKDDLTDPVYPLLPDEVEAYCIIVKLYSIIL